MRGKALLRDIIDVGSRITQDAFREPEDVSQALDAAEQLIYGVSNRTLRDHLAPVSELAPGTLEMIQRLYEAEGEVTGVETGFEDLDRLTTGFHKSDLVILAARPAMGKDSEIVLDDGRVATIEEVFARQAVLTLGDNLKLGWTPRCMDDGVSGFPGDHRSRRSRPPSPILSLRCGWPARRAIGRDHVRYRAGCRCSATSRSVSIASSCSPILATATYLCCPFTNASASS